MRGAMHIMRSGPVGGRIAARTDGAPWGSDAPGCHLR